MLAMTEVVLTVGGARGTSFVRGEGNSARFFPIGLYVSPLSGNLVATVYYSFEFFIGFMRRLYRMGVYSVVLISIPYVPFLLLLF